LYYIWLRLLYHNLNACVGCLDVAVPEGVVLGRPQYQPPHLTSAPGETFPMATCRQLRASDLSWSLLQPASPCCPQKLPEIRAAKGPCSASELQQYLHMGCDLCPYKVLGDTTAENDTQCLSLKYANLSKVSLPSAGGCGGETKKVNKLSQSIPHRDLPLLLDRAQRIVRLLPRKIAGAPGCV